MMTTVGFQNGFQKRGVSGGKSFFFSEAFDWRFFSSRPSRGESMPRTPYPKYCTVYTYPDPPPYAFRQAGLGQVGFWSG